MDSVSGTVSDSSKTGSSLTKPWSDEVTEIDFTVDSEVSPVSLECFIQTERITKLLQMAIYKTKLAVCLPLLIRGQGTLAQCLKPQDLQEVQLIYNQYDNPLFSTSAIDMDAMEDIQNSEEKLPPVRKKPQLRRDGKKLREGDVTLKHRLSPELGHLLYTLNKYKELRPNIELMIQKMRSDFYKAGDHKSHIPVGFEYLLQLERLHELVVARVTTTAAQQLRASLETKKLEASNQDLVKKISKYRNKLEEESKDFEKVLEEKKSTIAKLELEVRRLCQAANDTLRKRELDSERQMVLMARGHLAKAEIIKEEEVETREVYDKLLKEHVLDETNIRQRRRKVETQLLSWIQKYDADMQEKQNELDELVKTYDEETDLVKKLENQLEEQDKEYALLMGERDAEYHAEMAEKMNRFRIEHAARVIQTAWRDVLANRAENKTLRKLLKQKQAAEAAAAKKAEAEAKLAAAAAKKAAAAEKKAAKAAAFEAKAAAAKEAKEAKDEEDD